MKSQVGPQDIASLKELGLSPLSESETRLNTHRSTGLRGTGLENAVLYVPQGLSEGKRYLINQVIPHFRHVIEGDVRAVADLPWEMVPCTGSQVEMRDVIHDWMRTGRPFFYWDRGYLNRGGKTWLPSTGPSYFRWHLSSYQMTKVEPSHGRRFARLGVNVRPWKQGGQAIVVAAPSEHYAWFHGLGGWVERTVEAVREFGRPIIVRHKLTRRSLDWDLRHACCLVTHGSVAAVEAVVMGVPVIVDPVSAAAPVGRTSLADIENLIRPDRTAWLNSLADNQFTLREIGAGMLWEKLGWQ